MENKKPYYKYPDFTEKQLLFIENQHENDKDQLFVSSEILNQDEIDNYIKSGYAVYPNLDGDFNTTLEQLNYEMELNDSVEYVVVRYKR